MRLGTTVILYVVVSMLTWSVPGWGMYGSLALALICLLLLCTNLDEYWMSLGLGGMVSGLMAMLFNVAHTLREWTVLDQLYPWTVGSVLLIFFAWFPLRVRRGEKKAYHDLINVRFYRTMFQIMAVGGFLIATSGNPVIWGLGTLVAMIVFSIMHFAGVMGLAG